MTVRILRGDVLDVLPTLPDESVHCVVTSPPYWGLRDYGVAGQIGLESTPQEYVEKMVAVFREVRRVLRSDKTLWLNLGDSYATGAGGVGECPGGGKQGESWKMRGKMTPPNRLRLPGLKAKDLVGIPWRVAFALQADGWYLRQDIIWAKPNPMPESVRDRCTKAGLLAYSFKRRTATTPPPGQPTQHRDDREDIAYVGTRNKRSVWTVATQPYAEAHFATFPPALIEPCILAGCPEDGTVLDPFGGAGTTGLVADRQQRNAILIELNPEYAVMAERRIKGDAPLFSEITT